MKICSIIFLILLICWGTIFLIDRDRTLSLREPIFAQLKFTEESYPSRSIYKGIGYTIIVTRDSNIISITMTIFNQIIAASIT
ncbi:MAG: hypothetical protein Q4G05_06820 [Clostridia bacterium]|nr:hypothetical protein [Clostridia bacterium]